jgi:rSAM/selenodomain-associated transferase 2/rSAM/selenodomain-associated transferase 1
MADPPRIILFTRWPEPGRTKTRLAPVLGPEGAAAFQRRLTEHAFGTARAAAERLGATLEVRFEGGDEGRMRGWLGPGALYRAQDAGDIGRRMAVSLGAGPAPAGERRVLIGSDIPGMRAEHLIDAFERLHRADLVFGPAADGGYWLIGATASALALGTPYLGPRVRWGSKHVLADTLERVRDAGLRHALVDRLADVDRPEDIGPAVTALGRASPVALTVVVAALNEEEQLAATLQSCRAAGAETVVVDGGSVDCTPAIAAAAGVRLLRARPPRAVQMNAGAALANGATLLFLHGDTRLPAGFLLQVGRTLDRPKVVAGAYRLGIDAPGAGLRVIERVANWRSERLQMPYGDQGLFLPAARFWELGGFPALPFMEDFEMVHRLRRVGRIALAGGQVRTSARRWQRLGIVRTWLVNQGVITAYRLGVSPARLARWYRGPMR